MVSDLPKDGSQTGPRILSPHKNDKEIIMNKAQLIEAISMSANVTKTDAENCLNSALDSIKKSVKKGDDVTLVGFGTFTKAKRKARMGRNPQTGKEIKIPAMTVPKFRPGREFKEAVN